ncbi:MAG TPA: DUF2510 domain-containing protein [Acidimicrobiales bacterium]
MDGNPAGWYDDPEDAGSKRYWDGTAWTQDRAPAWNAVTSESARPFDPLRGTGSRADPSLSPPSSPPSAGESRRGLWVALAVIGVVAVVGIVALVALSLGGDDTDHTREVEQNLPVALERNYADQGLDVTVTGATCEKVATGSGAFTTSCTVGFRGTDRTLVATVTGAINDDGTATIDNAVSDTNVLDEELALDPAQALVDQRIEGLTVTACTLPQSPLVMQDGDEFTCDLSNGQTVTLSVEGASVRLTAVS